MISKQVLLLGLPRHMYLHEKQVHRHTSFGRVVSFFINRDEAGVLTGGKTAMKLFEE